MANINEMSPAARKKFGCFGVAFGSLFLLVGLFVMSVGIKNGMKQMDTSSWLSVDGVIISNNFNKRNQYCPKDFTIIPLVNKGVH